MFFNIFLPHSHQNVRSGKCPRLFHQKTPDLNDGGGREFQTVSIVLFIFFFKCCKFFYLSLPALQITATQNMGQWLWNKYGCEEGKIRFHEAPCLKLDSKSIFFPCFQFPKFPSGYGRNLQPGMCRNPCGDWQTYGQCAHGEHEECLPGVVHVFLCRECEIWRVWEVACHSLVQAALSFLFGTRLRGTQGALGHQVRLVYGWGRQGVVHDQAFLCWLHWWPEQGDDYVVHFGTLGPNGILATNSVFPSFSHWLKSVYFTFCLFLSKQFQFQEVCEEMLEEDEDMCRVVASMRLVKCNYKKHSTPEGFLYETLSGLALWWCPSMSHQHDIIESYSVPQ